ncbi:hypothetical protein GCM10028790_41250 [Micromonospora taraxaci]
MSILRPGDEKFHYSDGSHRWIPPDPDYDQEIWDEQVRQHKHGHLRTATLPFLTTGGCVVPGRVAVAGSPPRRLSVGPLGAGRRR